MSNHNIYPIREIGPHRTGTLTVDFDRLVEVLGEPNVTDLDDCRKVPASWGFQDEKGRKGFVWCYKEEPSTCRYWSTHGPQDLFVELFGVEEINL